MTVYVVWQTDYHPDGCFIVGVFTYEDRAHEVCATLNEKQDHDLFVEPFKLDQIEAPFDEQYAGPVAKHVLEHRAWQEKFDLERKFEQYVREHEQVSFKEWIATQC